MKSILSLFIFCALLTVPLNAQWAGILGASRATGGGGGTTPGTTSLLAWFDFNSNANDASANAYNNDTAGSPTFTIGTPNYITLGSGNRCFNTSALRDTFDGSAQDWSYVIRWRAFAGVVNNDQPTHGSRFNVTYNTTAITASIGNVTKTTTTAGTTGTWYTTVVSWNNATTTLSVSINGETYATTTGTRDNVAFTIYFADQVNFDVDYAAFYSKQLTQANVTWLYNSGGTRLFSDL